MTPPPREVEVFLRQAICSSPFAIRWLWVRLRWIGWRVMMIASWCDCKTRAPLSRWSGLLVDEEMMPCIHPNAADGESTPDLSLPSLFHSFSETFWQINIQYSMYIHLLFMMYSYTWIYWPRANRNSFRTNSPFGLSHISCHWVWGSRSRYDVDVWQP